MTVAGWLPSLNASIAAVNWPPFMPASTALPCRALPLLPWHAAQEEASVRMWGVLLWVSVDETTTAACANEALNVSIADNKPIKTEYFIVFLF